MLGAMVINRLGNAFGQWLAGLTDKPDHHMALSLAVKEAVEALNKATVVLTETYGAMCMMEGSQ